MKKVNMSSISNKINFIYGDECEKNTVGMVIFSDGTNYFFDEKFNNKMSNEEVEALLLRGAVIFKDDKYYKPTSFDDENVSFGGGAIVDPGDIEVDLSDYATKELTEGINKLNDGEHILGYYDGDGNFKTSTGKYRHVILSVEPGQVLTGITDTNINYKSFVVVDDSDNIIGVSNSSGTYITTRKYVVLDGTGYHAYSFTIPEGIHKIYFQYSNTLLGAADMLVIDEDIPSTYVPYEKRMMLDKEITVYNSINAEYASKITSPLKGKNIGFLGDSFTAGTTSYTSYIVERTKCIEYNYGVGGTRISLDSESAGLSFIHRVAGMDENLDIICVFGGINDASKYDLTNSLYGTIDDAIMTDEEIADGVTEPSSFYGAVKTLLSQLIYKYPEKLIVMVIPPHVLDESFEPSITAYIGIDKVVKALRECAEYYGIPTIDLYKNAQYLNNHPSNVALYRTATNNIHPNSKGHLAMSYDIQKGIENLVRE